MYDIKQLEDDWHQYNKKRKRPFYIILLLILFFVVFIALYLSNKITFKFDNLNFNGFVTKNNIEEKNTDSSELIVVKEKEQKVPTIIGKTTVIDKPESVKEKVIVQETPKVKIEIEPKGYDTANVEPVLEVIDTPSVDNQLKTVDSTKEEIVTKKVHLDILETSSVTAYKDVERRFYETHDPDDSLFLSKSYFNRGDYKKAEYWALQTNKVDDGIEESWLLFAKSRAKLGYKQDAIKVLKSYIKRSNSLQAKRLLEKIK